MTIGLVFIAFFAGFYLRDIDKAFDRWLLWLVCKGEERKEQGEAHARVAAPVHGTPKRSDFPVSDLGEFPTAAELAARSNALSKRLGCHDARCPGKGKHPCHDLDCKNHMRRA